MLKSVRDFVFRRVPEGYTQQPSPPDLEQILRQFGQKLKMAISGRGGVKPAQPQQGQFGLGWLFLALIILFALIWVVSGIFIVQPAERAVILRFGKYVRTMGAGPHWIPAWIEQRKIVNAEKIANFTYQSNMLSKDENILLVRVAIQYRIKDPNQFLFNVIAPEQSLQQAAASALRQVIGHNALNDVLTVGRDRVKDDIEKELKQILKPYESGLEVMAVALQSAQVPEKVKDAFDDVIKAQADKVRFQDQAKAYTNQVVPEAEGQAQRVLTEANGYSQRVKNKAEGEVALYLALLESYRKQPDIIRKQLYFDTMSTVLSKTRKIFVDSSQNKSVQPLVYLPLDKLFSKTKAKEKPALVKPEAQINSEDALVAPPEPVHTLKTVRRGREDNGS